MLKPDQEEGNPWWRWHDDAAKQRTPVRSGIGCSLPIVPEIIRKLAQHIKGKQHASQTPAILAMVLFINTQQHVWWQGDTSADPGNARCTRVAVRWGKSYKISLYRARRKVMLPFGRMKQPPVDTIIRSNLSAGVDELAAQLPLGSFLPCVCLPLASAAQSRCKQGECSRSWVSTSLLRGKG